MRGPLLALALCASGALHAQAPVVEAPAFDPLVVETLEVPAPGVSDTPLRVRAWLPPGYASGNGRHPVLYVNDGQDMEAVGLQAALEAAYREGAIRPLLVVAIDMPRDRMGAYGLSDRSAAAPIVAQTRYGPVGDKAQAYSRWLAEILVPAIDARYRTIARADGRAILGWSLGALNAFGVGWQSPELFGKVGAFSPSFWLSADRADADAVQATRLVHRLVDASTRMPRPELFFAVGTAEEGSDRDGDGVFDALDDVHDLLDGWTAPDGTARKGLRQSGYRVDADWAHAPGRGNAALFLLEGGRHDQPSWARILPVFLRWAYAWRAPPVAATGNVEGWHELPSRHVAARDVDVWLPPGYAGNPGRRYPVLYMHDGQNLFDPALVAAHGDWDVDGAMTRLVESGEVRPAIVVGIWNTPRRFEEYMPDVGGGDTVATGVDWYPPVPRASLRPDAYLRFIVEELKPFIDARYRTLPGPGDTLVMGSSMGGLASLYALARFPGVFGGAGAVSTHWPAGDCAMVDWLASNLPPAGTHRIWFDRGTETLDASYAACQQRMDEAMRATDWVEGRDWSSRVYPGAGHEEGSWRARLAHPLRFLLGPPR